MKKSIIIYCEIVTERGNKITQIDIEIVEHKIS